MAIEQLLALAFVDRWSRHRAFSRYSGVTVGFVGYWTFVDVSDRWNRSVDRGDR